MDGHHARPAIAGVRPSSSVLVLPPRERVRKLAGSIGEAESAGWCALLLAGRIRYDDRRYPALTWLGGVHAANLLKRPESREVDYFPRVWAARALLYAWAADAAPAVVAALTDPAWRVREMCAKVARKRLIGQAIPVLDRLAADPILRVRAAAERALDALTTSDLHKTR